MTAKKIKVGELTPPQSKAVQALASGATFAEAALLAGVSERTVYKWRADLPAFNEALKSIEVKQLDETARRLVGAGVQCVSCLTDIAADKKIAPGVRVAAAKAVMELSLKLRDTLTIEARLTELEAQLRLKT